ncbi:MAG: DUF5597 domain-containing protein [Melioribacteraceae bacterium]|nr:DUF5597 domain-containing protein [Melioribacteraceae bacterium]
MNKSKIFSLIVLIFFVVNINFAQVKNHSIPKIVKYENAFHLIVNENPYLILGGELGNSNASTKDYLDSVWPKLKKMNLNTVLIPVYWELIEPEENKFDFTLVDYAIKSARKNNIKIVFLWFGSWKNSMSCYVPGWIKINQERFPRAKSKEGISQEILTPFNENNLNADVKAYSELMKFIKKIDEKEQTVIMMQVENEIGMLPDARDYCEEANKKFESFIPQELINYLKNNFDKLTENIKEKIQNKDLNKNYKWEELFGKGLDTDEIFMAWYFAKYTNEVAKAGKIIYPIPTYVNAALIRKGYKPGQYPSAGPLPHLRNIWNAAAPNIDMLSMDIYFKNFTEWLAKYDWEGNPVFIPEADRFQGAANALYAIAQHNAFGYSPFSVENSEEPILTQFQQAYDVLNQMKPIILESFGKNKMKGVLLDSANHSMEIELGNYIFNVKHEYSWPYASKQQGQTPRFGGMIIMINPNEFYFVGTGMVITVKPSVNDGSIAGIKFDEEGIFDNGKWKTIRVLNGDETHQGRHIHLTGNKFTIQKASFYIYK